LGPLGVTGPNREKNDRVHIGGASHGRSIRCRPDFQSYGGGTEALAWAFPRVWVRPTLCRWKVRIGSGEYWKPKEVFLPPRSGIEGATLGMKGVVGRPRRRWLIILLGGLAAAILGISLLLALILPPAGTGIPCGVPPCNGHTACTGGCPERQLLAITALVALFAGPVVGLIGTIDWFRSRTSHPVTQSP
jgi:hypothetical protein